MIVVIETNDGFKRLTNQTDFVTKDGERRASLSTILHESWSPSDRADFGIYLAQEAVVPNGHVVLDENFELDDVTGLIEQRLTTEQSRSVPVTVSPRQMRKALRNLGFKPAVDAYLAQASEEINEDWEYATSVDRDNELIAVAAQGLGLSNEDVDNLFRLAVTFK